ncbi:hypothetical protein WMF04_44550 [Sorangium sp. So ce260]|uniref:hypothetical protein n=1 Tax=Sorangium sp. So ce260 TaxID=3133291 RepID=UPI003F5F1DC2
MGGRRGAPPLRSAQTEAGLELRRATPGDCPSTETIADEVGGILTVLAGSKVMTDAWASPDGSKVPFFNQRDPTTGLSDVAAAASPSRRTSRYDGRPLFGRGR